MSEELKIATVGSEEGSIHVNLLNSEGQEYHLPLSAFDVSTLVSMLYEARSQATSIPNDKGPEVMLQIFGMTFGEDAKHQILRIAVTEFAFQDFCAPKESEAGRLLQQFSRAMATTLGQSPTPFGPQGREQ